MQTPNATDSRSSSLAADLRRQLREEIDGAEIKNPAKFALEQKFGLTDPVLVKEELHAIAAGAARDGK